MTPTETAHAEARIAIEYMLDNPNMYSNAALKLARQHMRATRPKRETVRDVAGGLLVLLSPAIFLATVLVLDWVTRLFGD